MKLYGRIIKETNIIREAFAENYDESISYTDRLEDCLVNLCRELDISVPMWLEKNTKEFVAYHRTFFSSEQFIEKVEFDRFEIRVE